MIAETIDTPPSVYYEFTHVCSNMRMKTALYEWFVIFLYVLYKLTEQIFRLSSRILQIQLGNQQKIGDMELAKIAKNLVKCVSTGEVSQKYVNSARERERERLSLLVQRYICIFICMNGTTDKMVVDA